jgi:ATP-dependent Clp protease ATP-binding subunit ClpC
MFERFTDRARHVVVLAQDESRLLNQDYIGTEHILLGLMREDEGVAAKALESLGLSLQALRTEVEVILGRGDSAPSGHIPFTPRAKKVLELSLREALQLGHNYIGTEHILLGLIRECEGVGALVLVKLGGDLGRARQQVMDILAGRSMRARYGLVAVLVLALSTSACEGKRSQAHTQPALQSYSNQGLSLVALGLAITLSWLFSG